ncbi:cellulose binding domain-containing protein [Actinoplanes rectilineatus]|uniref:cellulose binding domain-containing protein n=1 Tax=Actinoplanes rectilineatus TaxID=113571 RepID=UPI0005F2F079|nr:cellulose binding domain-containing protein [Actinoplanes rectilineatus]
MSKHATRRFILARIVFGSGAAVLLALVGWVAIRAGGPAKADDEPLLVQPSVVAEAQAAALTPPAPVPASPTVSASVSVSPSVSASATPSKTSASPSGSATPSATSASAKPSKTTAAASPTPSKTTVAPADDLSVSYSNSASWRDGFIASIKVTNTGAAKDFTINLSYPSDAGVRVRGGGWNVSVSGDDGRVTLTGSVNAGATVNVGFQASKDSRNTVKPSACSVGGGTCSVS